MSVKFHTIVELSDKTAIEYDVFAENKSKANKKPKLWEGLAMLIPFTLVVIALILSIIYLNK